MGSTGPSGLVSGRSPGSSEHLVTNTQSVDASVRIGVHWLTLYIDYREDVGEHEQVGTYDHNSIVARIAGFLGCEFGDFQTVGNVRPRWGGPMQRYVGPVGVQIFFDTVLDADEQFKSHAPDGYVRCKLQIDGSGCDWIESKALGRIGHYFRDNGCIVRCSRIDVAHDSELIPMDEVIESVESGRVRTSSKSYRIFETRSSNEDEPSGRTVYLGSNRQSERVLCCYDRRGPVRAEMRYQRKRADIAYWALFPRGGAPLQKDVATRLLVDFADFVEVTSDSNISRAPRAGWWDRFVGGVTRLRVLLPRPVRTVEKAREWVRRTVAPTLAMLRAVSGEKQFQGYLSEWIRQGEMRFRDWHERIINAHGAKVPVSQGCSTYQ